MDHWLQQLLTTLTSLFLILLVPPSCFWGWLWVSLCFVLQFVNLLKSFQHFCMFKAGIGISYICSVCHIDRKCSHLLVPLYPVIVITVRIWSLLSSVCGKVDSASHVSSFIFSCLGFGVSQTKAIMTLVSGIPMGPPRLPLQKASREFTDNAEAKLKSLDFLSFTDLKDGNLEACS